MLFKKIIITTIINTLELISRNLVFVYFHLLIEMKYRYFPDLQFLAQTVVVSHPSFPIRKVSYLANKLRINLQMAAGHLISIRTRLISPNDIFFLCAGRLSA